MPSDDDKAYDALKITLGDRRSDENTNIYPANAVCVHLFEQVSQVVDPCGEWRLER